MKKNSVFISSVFSELQDVRQDVINAVLQNGDLPICMERFNSHFGKTADILKRYISESDYFVLIIGDQYGDIEPDSGYSYTEYEYNVAIQLGLKPIVFLKKSESRDDRTKDFVRRIDEAKSSMWFNWSTTSQLVASIITSLRDAEENDPREGWVRGGIQIEACSSKDYTDFVLKQEKESKELIILPKRLNTAYKPESMIVEIADQRYGHGANVDGYEKYILGHVERSKQFFDFLASGKMYYELFNKSTIIEYVKGMHHNGIKHLNNKYMEEMLEKWKETIRKYSKNYFIGFVDAILPFKYEIFDRRIVSMHETVGRHAKNRVSALIIREENVVRGLVNDFETMWNTLDPEECFPDSVCEWIDDNLIMPLNNRSYSIETHIDATHGRKINAFGSTNLRDLGGLLTKDGSYTKYGVLFRSDLPKTVSSDDYEFINNKKVSLCIDIRHASVVEAKPSALSQIEGLKYVNYGYDDDFNNRIVTYMESDNPNAEIWGDIFIQVIEGQRLWIKNIITEISNADGASIYHCTWGRDRTGLLTVILLLLANVEESEIIADYLYSVSNISQTIDSDITAGRSANAVKKLIQYIEQKYYSVENYLFLCGISIEDINRVKARLVG